MSQTAAGKLESSMKKEGLLIINQSLVSAKVSRKDIRVIYVPANHLAKELGNDSVANIVALGTLVAECPAVARSSIITVMDSLFAKNQKALEINQQAFSKGLKWRLQ